MASDSGDFFRSMTSSGPLSASLPTCLIAQVVLLQRHSMIINHPVELSSVITHFISQKEK